MPPFVDLNFSWLLCRQDQCILLNFSVLLEKSEKLIELELSVAAVFRQNRISHSGKKPVPVI